jgi:hypothetical protein
MSQLRNPRTKTTLRQPLVHGPKASWNVKPYHSMQPSNRRIPSSHKLLMRHTGVSKIWDVPQCWEPAEKGYKGKERYDQDYDRHSSYDPHIDISCFWIVREEKANDIIEATRLSLSQLFLCRVGDVVIHTRRMTASKHPV